MMSIPLSMRSLTLPVASVTAPLLLMIDGYRPLKTAIDATTPPIISRMVTMTLSTIVPLAQDREQGQL